MATGRDPNLKLLIQGVLDVERLSAEAGHTQPRQSFEFPRLPTLPFVHPEGKQVLSSTSGGLSVSCRCLQEPRRLVPRECILACKYTPASEAGVLTTRQMWRISGMPKE